MTDKWPNTDIFGSNDPAEALKTLMAFWRKHGYGDPRIVEELTGYWLNAKQEAHRRLVMEEMKALSPHLQRTNGELTPRIQQMFQAAIDSDDVHDALINGIVGLRKEGLDKGGIQFELDLFRAARRDVLNEDQETYILDMMDGLVEYGNDRNLFDYDGSSG